MRIRVTGLLMVLLLGASPGCISLSDPMGWRNALKNSQLTYTQSIRWGNLEKAGEFVDPELREEFLQVATAFANIRITDYEIGSIHYTSSSEATVNVTYRAYARSTYLDRVIRETQEWRRTSIGGQWRVRPTIQKLVAGIK